MFIKEREKEKDIHVEIQVHVSTRILTYLAVVVDDLLDHLPNCLQLMC